MSTRGGGATLWLSVMTGPGFARSHFEQADEQEAESFGLLLASKCRTLLAGSGHRAPVQRDHLAGRIEASLGYLGPQG